MKATSSSLAGPLTVRNSVLEAIGNTPAGKLRKVVTRDMADVVVKLEYYNPTGSYKDRMALAMIEGAEGSGRLGPGLRVVHGRQHGKLARACVRD